MFLEETKDSIVIITIDIINNTRIPVTTLFFFKMYCPSPRSRNSMPLTDPQGTLTCSDKPYDNQSHQHRIGNSCLILLIMVFISSSNPCGTAQSAQWLGYGLQDLQEICPFSNVSTQATTLTHSAIQLVPQALILKVGKARVSPLTSNYCEVNNRWRHTSTALVKPHDFFFVPPQPNAGHGLLILDVSRSHTTTQHSR